MLLDDIKILEKNIKIDDSKYHAFINLKLNRNFYDSESIKFVVEDSDHKLSWLPLELVSDSRTNYVEYNYFVNLNEGETYYNPHLEIFINDNDGSHNELSEEFNIDNIHNGKIEYSNNASSNGFFSFSNSKFVWIFSIVISLVVLSFIAFTVFTLMRLII